MSTTIANRTGETRPPIERLQMLARYLRDHDGHFSAGGIARRFETSRKTITRDLEFMRDRLGYEFEFDCSAQRYVLRSAPKPVL